MKITVEDGCLMVGGRAIQYADIAEINSEKIGKITYDEVFLIVWDQFCAAVT